MQRRDLAGRLAVVELFGEQLDPLQHGGLEEEHKHSVSVSVYAGSSQNVK